MTKVSTSIALVWQLAAREAIAGKFPMIDPEHFLMALLKLAEVPPEQVEKLCPEEVMVGKELARDTLEVQNAVRVMGVDSTVTRRKLRTALGNGDAAYEGGEIHRSEKSREMFAEAARLADEDGCDVLMPCHLLAAIAAKPTEVVRNVLGECAGALSPACRLSGIIAEWGVDLTSPALKGELSAKPGRAAEARALLKILCGKDTQGVFLVCDAPEAAQDVMAALACLSVKENGGERRLRVVDFTLKPPPPAGGMPCGKTRHASSMDRPSSNLTVECIQRVLSETAGRPNLTVRIPDIEDARMVEETLSALKAILAKDVSMWVWRIDRKTHRDRIEIDTYWRRAVAVMSVTDRVFDAIPNEL